MNALKFSVWPVAQYALSGRKKIVKKESAESRGYPLGELSPVHREFALNVKDADSALSFVQRFGFLGLNGRDAHEESVEDIIEQKKSIYGFISLIDHGPGYMFDHATALTQLFNDRVAPAISTELEAANGRFALKIVPQTLLAYMWLQVASELIDGIEWRVCANPNCPHKWFPVRLSDLRLKDKMFCERVACRQAVSRQRRDEQQRGKRPRRSK